MKYKKFEKWMIGKKFYNKFDPDDIGVIIGESEHKGVLEVVYEIDGPSRANLCSIIFVDSAEEKPSYDKATSLGSIQIDWQVGQEVFCLLRGKGFVESVDDNEGSPYTVGVDFGYTFDKYTIDGKIYDDHKGRVLFFSEPVITAELYPPKKPFAPTLKKGEVVIATTLAPEEQSIVVFVNKEAEECVEGYTTQGLTLYTYDKCKFKFYKVGEEIKFES